MSKVITFDKGSKRRLNQIRWKLAELLSLALLALFIFTTSLLILRWELEHEHPDDGPPKVPQIKGIGPNAL